MAKRRTKKRTNRLSRISMKKRNIKRRGTKRRGTKRRGIKRRGTKTKERRKRSRRRSTRNMRGGGKWICGGCGVMTNTSPCALERPESYRYRLPDGKWEERWTSIQCGHVRPPPAAGGEARQRELQARIDQGELSIYDD